MIIITVNYGIACDIDRNMILHIHRKSGIGIAIRSSCNFLNIEHTFTRVLSFYIFICKVKCLPVRRNGLVLIYSKCYCYFLVDNDFKFAELIVLKYKIFSKYKNQYLFITFPKILLFRSWSLDQYS